jgi:methylated-DNA-protein-cysteine methyltransferase related protein
VTEFERRVRSVVSALRPGDVVTYGEIAEEAGFPGAARAVGGVMARCDGLPWWRVVTSTGRLVPGHEAEQRRRLRAEGVEVGPSGPLSGKGRRVRAQAHIHAGRDSDGHAPSTGTS